MELMDEGVLVLELREGTPVVLGLPEDRPPLYGAWEGKIYELVDAAAPSKAIPRYF